MPLIEVLDGLQCKNFKVMHNQIFKDHYSLWVWPQYTGHGIQCPWSYPWGLITIGYSGSFGTSDFLLK